MAPDTIYEPKYRASHAIVIGINSYEHASPLGFARQDAEGVSALLISKHGFEKENVRLLLDEGASRGSIMKEFLSLAGEEIHRDDRIFVFFAGHGFTKTGNRGEIGYLVPVDGNPADLSTLIRWDELTRNSDLIAAKHVLFVMDACYGGLAIKRTLPPGSQRFLKNMLQRYSRQVLTAGKADEAVADSGGPRPGHSIFTGHFLDALDGKAASGDGIVSANAVMAYVYRHVGQDPHSTQSPHYGFIDGDGDFIFTAPNLNGPSESLEKGDDTLIQIPAGITTHSENTEVRLESRLKDYLSDPKNRIRLNDAANQEIRSLLQNIGETEFPSDAADVNAELFIERLRKYETLSLSLRTLVILVSHWGNETHRGILERVGSRLTENIEPRNGKVVWLAIRWFPIKLLLYSGGIAALSSKNYDNLAALLLVSRSAKTSEDKSEFLLLALEKGISGLQEIKMFNKLPGYERNYVPESEYLYKTLQPLLEDLLFLGSDYEELFDRFEIIRTLCYVDLRGIKNWIWGPPGRFCWKLQNGMGQNPYDKLVSEAESHGDAWGPLKAGFFNGSILRFKEVAIAYRAFVQKLGYH